MIDKMAVKGSKKYDTTTNSTQTVSTKCFMLLRSPFLRAEVEVEVKLRPTVSRQSVLVSGTHLGPATNSSFSLKLSLDSRGFVIL
jgi:hypothetical protein